MKDDIENVKHNDPPINGRTEGPFGSDDADVDRGEEDNRNQYDQENSANGLDSEQVRGSQDGRNERAIGSTDMDGKNGILRMGDQNNSTMEVTEEGISSAVESEGKTNTGMVDVTTAGPDDDASADQMAVPNAQKKAKQASGKQKDHKSAIDSQKKTEKDVAQTGTDLTNEPVY